jgi:hypothetical protein
MNIFTFGMGQFLFVLNDGLHKAISKADAKESKFLLGGHPHEVY